MQSLIKISQCHAKQDYIIIDVRQNEGLSISCRRAATSGNHMSPLNKKNKKSGKWNKPPHKQITLACRTEDKDTLSHHVIR